MQYSISFQPPVRCETHLMLITVIWAICFQANIYSEVDTECLLIVFYCVFLTPMRRGVVFVFLLYMPSYIVSSMAQSPDYQGKLFQECKGIKAILRRKNVYTLYMIPFHHRDCSWHCHQSPRPLLPLRLPCHEMLPMDNWTVCLLLSVSHAGVMCLLLTFYPHVQERNLGVMEECPCAFNIKSWIIYLWIFFRHGLHFVGWLVGQNVKAVLFHIQGPPPAFTLLSLTSSHCSEVTYLQLTPAF